MVSLFFMFVEQRFFPFDRHRFSLLETTSDTHRRTMFGLLQWTLRQEVLSESGHLHDQCPDARHGLSQGECHSTMERSDRTNEFNCRQGDASEQVGDRSEFIEDEISVSRCSIRAIFGTNEQKNAVHGSDSAVSAEREIRYFFPNCKLIDLSSWKDDCSSGIVEPIPNGSSASDYLEQNVNQTLIKAVTALCKEKPKDPMVTPFFLSLCVDVELHRSLFSRHGSPINSWKSILTNRN
jgi:hypothetical protein